MFTIKTYSKVPAEGIKAFGDNFKIEENPQDYDAIIVHSTPLHNEVFSKQCKAIVRVGAGVNTIPVDKCTENGIAVFNTPGGNANAVKELVLCTMIAIARNVKASEQWVCSLKDGAEEPGKEVENGKNQFKGPEVLGKTIGIIGVGNVGGRVAKACYDLGMKVMGYDPFLSTHKKDELKQYVNFCNDVNEIYKNSDFVSIHIPYNKENAKFLNEDAINMMKNGVYIINFARGEVVDNDAIVRALDAKKVLGFATDFPTKAQLNRIDCVCTPHLGAGTPEADSNTAIMASQQIKEYLESGNIVNSVNLPNISTPRSDGSRICLLHKNTVGMLGKITDILAKSGYNIETLSNKAKNDIAYTLLDLDVKFSDAETVKKLEQIENVIKVTVYD